MKIKYETTIPTHTQFENIHVSYEVELAWDVTQEDIFANKSKIELMIKDDIDRLSNYKASVTVVKAPESALRIICGEVVFEKKDGMWGTTDKKGNWTKQPGIVYGKD